MMLIFSAITVQLLNLQVRQGDAWLDKASETQRRTVTLRGQRGSILDINGVPLAVDQDSYDVQFTRDPSRKGAEGRAFHTKVIWQAIQTIQRNHGHILNTFPIVKNAQGNYEFNWGNLSEESAMKREEGWRKDLLLAKESTADEIMAQLRIRYSLPENISDQDELTLLAVWQDVALNAYRAYLPVTIAKNVSFATVVELELRINEMPGVSIARDTLRSYPRGELAAHIVGYTGRIQAEMDTKKMEDLGYAPDNYVGIIGVEASMEQVLTGNTVEHHGYQRVEVDSVGKINQVLEYVPPVPGYHVVLTIDSEMQKKAEEAFMHGLETIRNGGTDLIPYEERAELAEFGAMVVMDVNTCDVLSLVTYPFFDPNQFADGLTQEEADYYYKDPRNPMLNYAIGAQSLAPGGTPGSVLKMMVGLAGLEEGVVGVSETIDDVGPYTKRTVAGYRSPRCWIGNSYSKHNNQDIVQALKNSCNYYFFEIADRLGWEKLNKWADKLGLTSKTGIQINGENAGYMANPTIKQKKSFIPKLVRTALSRHLLEKTGNTTPDWVLNKLVELPYADSAELRKSIREIVENDMGITDAALVNDLVPEIRNLISEVQWTPMDTIQSGIGQSTTILSPIAMARYVAALVNGGNVYQANIIDSVLNSKGQVVEENEPRLVNNIGANPQYLERIKEGMREVVSLEDGGTAGKFFEGFPYSIGGKTGTAEVVASDENSNNAWFVCFAPFDDPQIAIAVFIPNGRKGAYATVPAREFLEYWFAEKAQVIQDTIPVSNQLLP